MMRQDVRRSLMVEGSRGFYEVGIRFGASRRIQRLKVEIDHPLFNHGSRTLRLAETADDSANRIR
jgi:hypothetical protein